MSHSLHHTDAADTAKLLQELDRDSKSRSLTGGYKTAMTVLFVLYSLTMIVMARCEMFMRFRISVTRRLRSEAFTRR